MRHVLNILEGTCMDCKFGDLNNTEEPCQHCGNTFDLWEAEEDDGRQ